MRNLDDEIMNHVFELCFLFGGFSLLFFTDHQPEYGLTTIIFAFFFACFSRMVKYL